MSGIGHMGDICERGSMGYMRYMGDLDSGFRASDARIDFFTGHYHAMHRPSGATLTTVCIAL